MIKHDFCEPLCQVASPFWTPETHYSQHLDTTLRDVEADPPQKHI